MKKSFSAMLIAFVGAGAVLPPVVMTVHTMVFQTELDRSSKAVNKAVCVRQLREAFVRGVAQLAPVVPEQKGPWLKGFVNDLVLAAAAPTGRGKTFPERADWVLDQGHTPMHSLRELNAKSTLTTLARKKVEQLRAAASDPAERTECANFLQTLNAYQKELDAHTRMTTEATPELVKFFDLINRRGLNRSAETGEYLIPAEAMGTATALIKITLRSKVNDLSESEKRLANQLALAKN